MDSGDQLASVADDDVVGLGLDEVERTWCCSAEVRIRSMASATMSDTGNRLTGRGTLALDARQVEQVLDDAIDAKRLGVDAFGEASGDRGIALELQGLGEQAERAHAVSSARARRWR